MTPWRLAQQRQQAIYERLLTLQSSTTQDLAQHFGTSAMTIRRDLEVLEGQGRLQRVHGGAVLAQGDLPYLLRTEQHSRQKEAIGQAAASQVRSGMTVFFDSGTTSMAVARALQSRTDLSFTVVTHAVNVASLFTLPRRQRVIVMGGEIYEDSLAAASAVTLSQIRSLNYDLFFMGCCGVEASAGITNTNVTEAQVKQDVHARAARTVLVADACKWAARTLAPVLPLSRVSLWVSDVGLPEEALAYATSQGVRVVRAGENGGNDGPPK